MTFLHGTEIVEDDSGVRVIATPASGVVGIVGTAEFADAAAFPLNTPVLIAGSDVEAAGLYSEAGAKDGSFYEQTLAACVPMVLLQAACSIVVIRVAAAYEDTPAELTGAAGPYVLTDGMTLVVDVDGDGDQTATFNTGDFADIGAATVSEVVAVLEADLTDVTVEVVEGAPVITSVSTGDSATLQVTGGTANGVLGFSTDEVTGETDALDRNTTAARVVGGVDAETDAYTGIKALLGAKGALNVKPKILIAPGFSHLDAVRTALDAAAAKLWGVAIFDGPNTTDAEALTEAAAISTRTSYYVDPHVEMTLPVYTESIERWTPPGSPIAAGVMASVNFWESPSNKTVRGVYNTARPVDFALGDATSRANLLNAGKVATFIREDGWRLWGNLSGSDDAKWQFISVTRTNFQIAEAIQAAHLWAVDRGITTTYLEDVVEGLNAYLAELRTAGAIINGSAWADAALNPPSSVAAGNAVFSYDFSPVYPAQNVRFNARMHNGYLVELFAAA